MATKYLQPSALFPSQRFGFSHVAVSKGNTTISVAGQVAIDEGQNVVGIGDLELQMNQALENMETALRTADASIDDIASMRIYVVGYKPEHGKVIGKALKTFFKPECLPASTWLGVTALAREELLVEIEVTAII